MKYGRLDFDRFVYDGYQVDKSVRNTINAGDALQMFTIEQIYQKMGIPDDQIIDISIHEIKDYKGEYVILPINWLSFNAAGNEKLFDLSPYIIPVYLGISISSLDLTEKQISNLKRYEPIGCRDERTLVYLRSLGVQSYLNGCIGTTYSSDERRNTDAEKYIYFVDVPKSITPFIPEEVKSHIRFFSQEIYVAKDEIPNHSTPSDWARSVIKEYQEHASLIVTSRFHGAVIGLALGIPVIITLENYTFRFSWLEKYLPLYTPKDFSRIDWHPVFPNFGNIKESIFNLAVNRIRETYEKYVDMLSLSELLENSERDHASDTNQTLYYESAINYIKNKWPENASFDYAFWGVNDNAEKIYCFLRDNYKNAKLCAVYDMYRDFEYKNLHSELPTCIDKDCQQFIFVTSYIASMYAATFFEKHGISNDRYFLCTREFVSKNDL